MTRRRKRIRKELLNDLTEMKEYRILKKDALHCTLWKTSFRRDSTWTCCGTNYGMYHHLAWIRAKYRAWIRVKNIPWIMEVPQRHSQPSKSAPTIHSFIYFTFHWSYTDVEIDMYTYCIITSKCTFTINCTLL